MAEWGSMSQSDIDKAARSYTGSSYANTKEPSLAKKKRTGSYGSSSFRPDNYRTISFAEALKQAQGMYEPLRDMERTDAGTIAQQQGGLLRQAMNARGQLGGGLANERAIGLSEGLQRNLANINSRFAAQTATAAQGLVDRSEQSAMQQRAQALQEWLANNQVAAADRTFDYQIGRDAVNDAMANKQFGLQEAGLLGRYNGLDTLAGRAANIQQWAYENSPEAQDWFLPLTKQGMEANIAVALRNARAPYGGGGGGGNTKVTTTDRSNAVLQGALNLLQSITPRGEQYPLKPKEAADYVIGQIYNDIAEMGLSTTELNRITGIIRNAAGDTSSNKEDSFDIEKYLQDQ